MIIGRLWRGSMNKMECLEPSTHLSFIGYELMVRTLLDSITMLLRSSRSHYQSNVLLKSGEEDVISGGYQSDVAASAIAPGILPARVVFRLRTQIPRRFQYRCARQTRSRSWLYILHAGHVTLVQIYPRFGIAVPNSLLNHITNDKEIQ